MSLPVVIEVHQDLGNRKFAGTQYLPYQWMCQKQLIFYHFPTRQEHSVVRCFTTNTTREIKGLKLVYKTELRASNHFNPDP